MVSIARKNLLEDLPRLLVAQAGITFAVSLIGVQTGILNGFTNSVTLVIDNSQADIWVTSKDFLHLSLTLPLPAERVNQARAVPGVAKAEPLLINNTLWRDPQGKIEAVQMIGYEPDAELFKPWDLIGGAQPSIVEQEHAIIIDDTNTKLLGVNNIGDVVQVGGVTAKVKAFTHGVYSFVASPFVFTSLESGRDFLSSRTIPASSTQSTSLLEASRLATEAQKASSGPIPIPYILIRAQPGQDLQQLKQALEQALPDTQAHTRAELSELTQRYWRDETGIGFVLSLGAGLGLVVGTVIVGQVLYASAVDHIREFGTLKAMGASNWYIYRVIGEQALWMAVLGFASGMGVCYGIGTWAQATQGIAILISPATAAGVFGVTVLMCVGSAVFAIQKVTQVDPVIVFKA
ncbi:FtsX-like permease family protein [Leptolyngbya sp. FACHB-261]|uniref:FtsX-like permease family protein n=1 Tax=Leptolyngbya sp. FACHB-261 TaxID=2692806 RepID=UPI001682BE00|nr:FtsX-like permease family protein [Leptolyngbya sp. FACHB-261]MBD2102157.1 ABC transporter permease [Leptolyngbya sp. FACHB-261]